MRDQKRSCSLRIKTWNFRSTRAWTCGVREMENSTKDGNYTGAYKGSEDDDEKR